MKYNIAILALLGLVSADKPVTVPVAAKADEAPAQALAEESEGDDSDDGEEGAALAQDEKKPKKAAKKGKKSASKGKKGAKKGKKGGKKSASKGKKGAAKKAEAAAPIIPAAGKGNPDNSRKVFEQHVSAAAKVVATQEAFEKAKTAEIKAANTKATNEANALKQKVRKAADDNMMGKTSPDHSKQQWTGPLLVQISEEPPKQAEPEKKEPEITAKKGTPQFSYETKAKAVASASETVSQQESEEAEWLKAHAANTAKAASETDNYSNGVKKGYTDRLNGNVTLPKLAEVKK